MDQELKQHLEGMEARIEAKLAKCATKDDLEGLKDNVEGLKDNVEGLKDNVEGLKDNVEGLKDNVEGLKDNVEGLKGDLEKFATKEGLEKVETNLLKAFYNWARPTEVRISGITNTVHGFDERLALVEQRVSELERRRPI